MVPIRVSANGRYFTDGNGRPFFWLGDTAWELFRCFMLQDARAIVERRRAQGFTVLQVMLTGVGDGSAPDLAGRTPWLDHDPARPNESYFRNVDAVVELAAREEMVLIVGVFHQLQAGRITTANGRAYARWVAQRYRRAPSLVWCMYPQATPEFAPVCRELASGLREADGGFHPVSVHPDPSPTSSSFLHDEPWLAFNMIQTCVRYELIDEMVRADYARTPVKPVVMAEGGYEGEEFGRLQTALEIRKQAYWSHLAGGYHTYGHNDSWVAPERWREWIDSPGAAHMGVYRQVVTDLPGWWDRVPDQSVFAGRAGSGLTRNVAARSAGGEWVMAYLSSGAPVSIRMDAITAAPSAEATWIDPTTGERTRIGAFPAAGVATFRPPDGWEDAVLVLA